MKGNQEKIHEDVKHFSRNVRKHIICIRKMRIPERRKKSRSASKVKNEFRLFFKRLCRKIRRRNIIILKTRNELFAVFVVFFCNQVKLFLNVHWRTACLLPEKHHNDFELHLQVVMHPSERILFTKTCASSVQRSRILLKLFFILYFFNR